MRLAIVGKTRSGKSTALHRILSHALRQQWAGILLLDGKGCERPSEVVEDHLALAGRPGRA